MPKSLTKSSPSPDTQTGSSKPQAGLLPNPVVESLQKLGEPVTMESYLQVGWGVSNLGELEGELREVAKGKLRQVGLLNEPDQT